MTVAGGLLLDLGAKSWAWLGLGGPIEDGGREIVIIPGWLRLVASRNPGVVFGLNFAEGLGLGPIPGRWFTVGLTVLASGLIFYIFAASTPKHRWLHACCGLILAGAMGNLYDRLVYGYVRDLIQITAQVNVAGMEVGWPYVFNLADVYLVVGVIAIAAMFVFAPDVARAGARKGSAGQEP